MPADNLNSSINCVVTFNSQQPPVFKEPRQPEQTRKLNEESKQLRQQQFTLGTAAFTTFTAYIFLFTPKDITPESVTYPKYQLIGSVLVLFMLYVMYEWSNRLRELIASISVYLKLTGASDWEDRFEQYYRSLPWLSQTRRVAYAYLVPGLIVLAHSCYFLRSSIFMLYIAIAISVAYINVILVRIVPFLSKHSRENKDKVFLYQWLIIFGRDRIFREALECCAKPEREEAIKRFEDAKALGHPGADYCLEMIDKSNGEIQTLHREHINTVVRWSKEGLGGQEPKSHIADKIEIINVYDKKCDCNIQLDSKYLLSLKNHLEDVVKVRAHIVCGNYFLAFLIVLIGCCCFYCGGDCMHGWLMAFVYFFFGVFINNIGDAMPKVFNERLYKITKRVFMN